MLKIQEETDINQQPLCFVNHLARFFNISIELQESINQLCLNNYLKTKFVVQKIFDELNWRKISQKV